ncbi:MAG: hypothetical protein BWY15_00410 [Firmicutes bacterium ADurb.Bin193]|nr:MAG: hypothetical protein BWY15_00410 [Firmicutes bacterium ADurb.Bin193]
MIKRATLLLLLILTCFITLLSVSSTTAVSYSVNLYEGGRIEATGNTSQPGGEVTFLVSKAGEPVIPPNIIHIYQATSAANGTFLFRFNLSEQLKETTLDFKVGGVGIDTVIKKTLTIPDFPINIASIEDNSVRAGVDVYQLFSPHYTADNVLDSIIAGGNTIYYRIGGNWYDLLDSRATSAAFFVPENAIDPGIVVMWQLDTWYPRTGFDTIKFDPVSLEE